MSGDALFDGENCRGWVGRTEGGEVYSGGILWKEGGVPHVWKICELGALCFVVLFVSRGRLRAKCTLKKDLKDIMVILASYHETVEYVARHLAECSDKIQNSSFVQN